MRKRCTAVLTSRTGPSPNVRDRTDSFISETASTIVIELQGWRAKRIVEAHDKYGASNMYWSDVGGRTQQNHGASGNRNLDILSHPLKSLNAPHYSDFST